MEIQYFDVPVPHVIIPNYFTQEELVAVWRELDFLTHERKMAGPESAGGHAYARRTSGLLLSQVYTDKKFSDIETITEKILAEPVRKQLQSKNFCFNWLDHETTNDVLINYYEESDHYKWHVDRSTFTAVTFLCKQPQRFTGGNLGLWASEDTPQHIIPFENNKFVLFPSFVRHAVQSVTFPEPNHPMSGWGRYTIAQFLFNRHRSKPSTPGPKPGVDPNPEKDKPGVYD